MIDFLLLFHRQVVLHTALESIHTKFISSASHICMLQLEAEGSHACHVGFKAGCLDPSHVLQTRSLVHVKSQYLWITVNAFILSCILHNLAGFFFLRNTRFPQNKLHIIYTAVWNRICTFRNTLIQNTLICWNINLWQISYAINTVCLQ